MAHLIDKNALVTEIERRVDAYQKNFDKADNKIARLSIDERIAGLKSLLSFLDTLEVKEDIEHYELEEFAKIVRGNLTGIDKNVQALFEAKYQQLTGNKMYGGYKD